MAPPHSECFAGVRDEEAATQGGWVIGPRSRNGGTRIGSRLSGPKLMRGLDSVSIHSGVQQHWLVPAMFQPRCQGLETER